MLITYSNSWQQGLRKKTIKPELKIGPVSLKFITLALIAIGALFYLAQSTQSAAFKYKVMELEDQKASIQTDIKQLEVESARLKSLNEIKSGTESLNWETAN